MQGVGTPLGSFTVGEAILFRSTALVLIAAAVARAGAALSRSSARRASASSPAPPSRCRTWRARSASTRGASTALTFGLGAALAGPHRRALRADHDAGARPWAAPSSWRPSSPSSSAARTSSSAPRPRRQCSAVIKAALTVLAGPALRPDRPAHRRHHRRSGCCPSGISGWSSCKAETPLSEHVARILSAPRRARRPSAAAGSSGSASLVVLAGGAASIRSSPTATRSATPPTSSSGSSWRSGLCLIWGYGGVAELRPDGLLRPRGLQLRRSHHQLRRGLWPHARRA